MSMPMRGGESTYERDLVLPADGTFDAAELAGLAGPVARYFETAIAPGTPLARTARIGMRGRIKVNRWIGFRGTELISPTAGFLWAVRAGPITGYDRYAGGEGEMRWKLLGLVRVMYAAGPDVSRSAAARAAGEGVWIPTALLPRFGTRWQATDDTHISSHHALGGHEITCHHTLDREARIVTTRIDRWGDPDRSGTYALHPFGVESTAWRTFGGLTIPTAGRAGWGHGTARWPDGIFFEYEITSVEPVTHGGGISGS